MLSYPASLALLLALGCTIPLGPPHTTSTPEERFLDASRVAFEPAVLAARRARLAEALRASGGGVFLAPSADGFSGGETFRQLDDFLYFTGLELPNAVLTLDAESGAAAIYAPRRDARFESATRSNESVMRRPRIARAASVSSGAFGLGTGSVLGRTYTHPRQTS